jgi:hypothetical protein
MRVPLPSKQTSSTAKNRALPLAKRNQPKVLPAGLTEDPDSEYDHCVTAYFPYLVQTLQEGSSQDLFSFRKVLFENSTTGKEATTLLRTVHADNPFFIITL